MFDVTRVQSKRRERERERERERAEHVEVMGNLLTIPFELLFVI
jgi:hypothetical protein